MPVDRDERFWAATMATKKGAESSGAPVTQGVGIKEQGKVIVKMDLPPSPAQRLAGVANGEKPKTNRKRSSGQV